MLEFVITVYMASVVWPVAYVNPSFNIPTIIFIIF